MQTVSCSVRTRAPMMRGTKPGDVRDWLRAICKRTGLTPTQLARESGLPPATINRFLNNTIGAPKNLNATTISRVRDAAERLIGPSDPITDVSSTTSDLGNDRWAVRSVEVIGGIAMLRCADEWKADQKYRLPIPISVEYAHLFVVAFEVQDQSIDLYYPQGSVVTCVPYAEMGRAPYSGERVVVHRARENGTEVSIRQYFVDENEEAWLLTRSQSPEYSDNLRLGKHGGRYPKGIAIPYRVTGSFRPE